MTTSITITKTTREEIGLPENLIDNTGTPTEEFIDAEDLPNGWQSFDGTDWDCPVFNTLTNGAWRVAINDPNNALNHQQVGNFVVVFQDDGGFYKKL